MDRRRPTEQHSGYIIQYIMNYHSIWHYTISNIHEIPRVYIFMLKIDKKNYNYKDKTIDIMEFY